MEEMTHDHMEHDITDENGEIGFCYDCNVTYKGSTLFAKGYNHAVSKMKEEKKEGERKT